MGITDIALSLIGLHIFENVYPFGFRDEHPNNAAICTIAGAGKNRTLDKLSLTVAYRNTDLKTAETKMNELGKRFRELEYAQPPGSESFIALVTKSALTPDYKGTDENGRHYFELNFELTITD